MTANVRAAKIGGYEFDAVFRKNSNGMMMPFVLISAIASWLGDGWSVERCMVIIRAEPWIEDALGERHPTEGLGLSPLGIAMLAVHSIEIVPTETKAKVADLVIGWVSNRTRAASSFG